MNRLYCVFILITIQGLFILEGIAQDADSQFFLLANNQKATTIIIDKNEPQVVFKAANLFQSDLFDIANNQPEIKNVIPKHQDQLIIAGTIGSSKWIDQLVKNNKLSVDKIKEQWESWCILIIKDPFDGINEALVIVGSDRRATAYGLLELSRMMGVSAWKWWADVSPKKQSVVKLMIKDSVYVSPSVKYRGLFINDEDWGLQPWAAKTFEKELGDIGPKTYEKVFELMLRLRANTIWPAMHSCTQAFYKVPGNAQMADDYAIVVSTSHCEPMLCNINAEWDNNTMGEWRYDNNAQTIQDLFKTRTRQTAGFENIYTIGMRGEHDSPMNTKQMTQDDQIHLLEKVIEDQRTILEKGKKQKADDIPQIFIPYKEVLEYYQNGLEVPDDVTLMWTDDNYGYIRQLSNANEQQRSGGAGVYYHASYWGRPHDYLWLSSTNPLLMWEEMSKAYALNAKRIWVLNCGDIKPLEYNIELFMDMAWDMNKFQNSQSVIEHMTQWYSGLFGADNAEELTSVMMKYNQLSFIRRPEFMAWSQTEPVTKPGQTELTQIHYGDEVTCRINDWDELYDKVNQISENIFDTDKDAFYELVYYPVVSAAMLNQKWLYHYKNVFTAVQGRSSASFYADKAKACYDTIMSNTFYYNHEIQHGKWNYIMNMAPRNLPVFSLPFSASSSAFEKTNLGIAVEGYEMESNDKIPNAYSNVLPVMNAYIQDSTFIDVFMQGTDNINWETKVNAPWIKLSCSNGKLDVNNPEQRIWVSIDWNLVPKGENRKEAPLGHDYQMIPPSYKVNSSIEFSSKDTTISIGVSVFNPELEDLNGFKGFVEGNGYVSVNAENYTSKTDGDNGMHWEDISGLGHSGSAMIAKPYNAEPIFEVDDIVSKSPALIYDFCTFNFGDADVYIQAVPTHPAYEPNRVRCAVAIDDAKPVIIDFKTEGRSNEWKQNVLKNAALKSAKQAIIAPGKHVLKVWMVDPGVMIDQILIDLGGWKESYSFPGETSCK